MSDHDHNHGHVAVGSHDHDHAHDSCSDCCSDEECCSHGKALHHDHNHIHESDDDCCEEGCCGHEHGQGHNHDHDHDHDHDHGHGHNHSHDSCCGDGVSDDCCGEDCGHDHSHASLGDGHDHDHGHNHDQGTNNAGDANESSDYFEPANFPDFVSLIPKHTFRVTSGDNRQNSSSSIGSFHDSLQISIEICAACDPNSEIPHNVQTTRLRIANLCCAGEERIIHNVLDGLKGVEHCNVNIINRYCVVKHCPVPCCAPVSKLLELLNEQRLGASVAEAVSNDDEEDMENSLNWLKIAHVMLVFILFIGGTITERILAHSHNDAHRQTISKSEVPSLVLFACSIGLGLIPVLQAAYISIFYRHTLDIHTLMVVAVIGAVIDKEYLDASLLMSLFISAELLEDIVMIRVRKAIRSSSSSSAIPKKAFLVSGKTVNVEALRIGDVIAVRAGDMIQADGVVVKGEGVVDESALTGEAQPVNKKKTTRVSSGTVVQNGYLEIKVDTLIEDSTIRKLNQAVQDVQADKGEYGRIVDRVAVYWTPLVLVLAVFLLLIGGGVSSDWDEYLHKALVMLVLACPCALVIAAPIPAVCAIATAAKNKVLIRGSTVIEKTGRVNVVASDKTGTLTRGFFKVLDRLMLSSGYGKHNALELAAALEQKSSHPLANAIVSAHCGCIAEMEGELPAAKKIKTIDGVGIGGLVEYPKGNWKQVYVGNDRLLKSNFMEGKIKVPLPDQLKVNEFVRCKAGTLLVYIVVDDKLEMILSLSDEIRPEASLAVSRFQQLGIDVCMLTGDTLAVAQEVCLLVGINEKSGCKARLLPADKLRHIQELEKDQNLRVMMIGDGINDAAALAGASVGVAMGAGGTAMACAAADIVMMSDNLLRLPSTVRLCSLSRSIIIQNCVICILVKIVAVVVAVLGLLKFWEAVLIDVGTLLLVIINGTRPLGFTGYSDTTDYVPGKALSFYDYMRSMSMSIASMRSNSNSVSPNYGKVPLLEADLSAADEVAWNSTHNDDESEADDSRLLEEGLCPTRKL